MIFVCLLRKPDMIRNGFERKEKDIIGVMTKNFLKSS